MAASKASRARINPTDATLKPFMNKASALVAVTATNDAGVVQFPPNTILQADDSRPSDVPMYRLLALLLEVYKNAVPGEGANEELGLVTLLVAASEGGGNAALQDLQKRGMIVGRAFNFLVVSPTLSGASRSSMRRAVVGGSTYLLLPSRLQLAQAPPAATPPHPYTNGDSPAKHVRPRQAQTWKRQHGDDRCMRRRSEPQPCIGTPHGLRRPEAGSDLISIALERYRDSTIYVHR